MNLVLHGLFFHVIVSIVQFQHGSTLCSAGEPGYLDFDNLPETNFSCQGKVIGGYYADVEAGCQMFHVCTIGQKDEIMDIKFLCLNGTVFDQETRVCERVDEVDCSKSERFYNLNLELYGNNAVTLSLHDTNVDSEDDPSVTLDENPHELQRTTSSRPSTTSTTTTTSQRPLLSSTTSSSDSYQRQNGYPQHYQPQPRFPSVQTSQSKSLYDDKNGGYHHQYIYHAGDHRTNNLENSNDPNNQNRNDNNNNNNNNNNNEATSYQLFNNQGIVSTTGSPRIHQIHYSSTSGPQIQIRNDHQPTLSPIFHATSSTIQTLLNSNANSPALINPIFHSHGIASTTEHFNAHNNNPRETDEYQDDDDDDDNDNDNDDDDDDENRDERRPLEAIQPTAEGKVSKLKISQIAVERESVRTVHRNKEEDTASDQQRIKASFIPTSSNNPAAVRSFYPTPRTTSKSTSSHVTQHIHVPPPISIPQLKPHRVTINLSPPDIQRIVQNPSPLLPSQSRVIVTAKASVSDESGRPLNSTQLVTLPLPTIPASYDDYKEGDESFDPFYRDVPKIRNNRRVNGRLRGPLRESVAASTMRKKRDATIGETSETRMEASGEISPDNGNNDDGKIMDNDESPEVAGNSTKFPQNLTETHRDDVYAGKHVDFDNARNVNVSSEIEETADSTGDNFYGKIFDESAERTSKEIDTRAIDDNTKYTRDDNKNNNFDDRGKKLSSESSKALGNNGNAVDDESSRYSLELPEVDESSREIHSSNGPPSEEKEENEEVEFTDDGDAREKESEEMKSSGEDYSNDDYYYEGDMDSSGLRSNEEHSVDYSKDSSSEVNRSKNDESSQSQESYDHEDRSIASEAFVDRDKSERFYDADEDHETSGGPTIRSNEEHFVEYSKDSSSEINRSKNDESSRSQESYDHEDRSIASEAFVDRDKSERFNDADEDHETSGGPTIRSNEEHFVEYSKDSSSEINRSKNDESSQSQESYDHEDRSIAPEAFVARDKSERFNDADEDHETSGGSTIRSNDEVNTRETSNENDEQTNDSPDTKNNEDTSTSEKSSHESRHEDSREIVSSTEINATTMDPESHDDSEGVLKFTDEIPVPEDANRTEETKRSSEDDESQDYIDDNYEPESYKENKDYSATTETIAEIFPEVATMLTENDDEKKTDDVSVTETTSLTNVTEIKDDKQNDEPAKASVDKEEIRETMEKPSHIEEDTFTTEVPIATTISSTTSTTTSTTSTTTSTTSTTTSTTTATTSTSTTTTSRPTPPKLFKPFTLRKSYVYVPPSTTPVPVIIKPRLTLLNPKPAKPPKSYNDNAPKPIIRKSLFARKIPPTLRTVTAASDDETEASTETSTNPTKVQNATEILVDPARMTIDSTEMKKSSTTSVDDLSTTKNDENVKIEGNNIPDTTSRILETLPITESHTFTPYPVVKMADQFSTISSVKEEDFAPETTRRIDVESNNVPNFNESDVGAMENSTKMELPSTPRREIIVDSKESVKRDKTPRIQSISDSSIERENTSKNDTSDDEIFKGNQQTLEESTTKRATANFDDPMKNDAPTLAPILKAEESHASYRNKPLTIKRVASFNCLEKEMYRFYADGRDCRLFHYCSPGFTPRQVLDFRFVCEEGTTFDEKSQNCVHDVKNPKCRKRVW